MALTFYYGSGSPFAWRVFLALEHKGIQYELKTLSFTAGDHKKPEYLAISPRHRVPAITDGNFNLYESAAIVEYLDDKYPDRPALFPRDVEQRAIARRIIHEIDVDLQPHVEKLVREVFFKKDPNEWDSTKIELGKKGCAEELRFFEAALTGDFLVGDLSAADFSLYPELALFARFEKRKPDLGLTDLFGPRLRAWMKRIETLPYFDKTYPPHWKA